MKLESSHELELIVSRVQTLAASIRRVSGKVPSATTPPMPVPLTVTSVEAWIAAAEEAIARPRIAESKKLLAEVGIDPASIAASVLGEPEQLRAIIEPLLAIPGALHDRSREIVARALTKGLADAQAAIQAMVAFAGSLSALLEMGGSCPTAVAVVLAAVPDTTDGFAAFLKRAQTIREHLVQTQRLGLHATFVEPTTIAEMESALTGFARSHRELHELIAKEGLTGKEKLQLKHMEVEKATAACESKHSAILKKKESLRERYRTLQRRLAAMGVAADEAPASVGELHDGVSSLEKKVADRHKELVGTLGEDAVLLVETVTSGDLPAPDKLNDGRLGKAVRRAAEAGFRIRIEAPDEDE